MKTRIYLLAAALFSFTFLHAQTPADVANTASASLSAKQGAADTLDGWHKGGTIAINVNEAGQNDYWSQVKGGNTSAIGIKGIIDYHFNKKAGKINWLNSFRGRYGGASSTTYTTATATTPAVKTKIPFLKNDDYFNFTSIYGKEFRKNWSYAAFLSIESQFDYIMNPGYIKVGPTFLYKPSNHFNLVLSPLMANITTKFTPSYKNIAAFGVDSGKTAAFGVGAFAQATLNYDLAKGINYKSVASAYSNYLKNPGNVILDWSNLFTFTVNKYIGATVTFNTRYNDLEIKHLQTQHSIGIGLSYKL
jgi:Protein of unknown function (DUF3078)